MTDYDEHHSYDEDSYAARPAAGVMTGAKRRPCTCRGYDPADPCGHGDTSEGCPRHDPNAAIAARHALTTEAHALTTEGLAQQVERLAAHALGISVVRRNAILHEVAARLRWLDANAAS